jgi:hypothetical protein
MNFVYDPSSEMSYGHWRCEPCGSSFYGGGKVIHQKNCDTKADYGDLTYNFTSKEAVSAIANVTRYENVSLPEGVSIADITTPLGPLTLHDLWRTAPELVIADRDGTL